MPAPLQIEMFPCLMDNYGFLVHAPDSGETAAIDTPEASKIIAACERKGWRLTHIWNTHHHPDHVGGNAELARRFDIEIFGPGNDVSRIPGLTHGVIDNDTFMFGGHEVQVIATPGHTTSHIVYYVPSADACFVGDTIFTLGCGRLFEGTPEDMFESLRRISALPDDTKLYCAHEYTLSNAKFAITVEPENGDLIDFIKSAKSLRDNGKPTVPTTVAAEKLSNPFVRAETAERLGAIRAAKDSF